MKKENFITMIMGTIGGILFAVGMCMCLISEWDSFVPGVVVAAIAAVILIAMLIVHRVMVGKPAFVKLNAKAIGTTILGIVGALVLGIGMCMVMVWDIMMPGILVGIIGIVLLMCLIPIIKGLK